MKKFILILSVFICNAISGQKIKTLNFGTFHMAYTPDEHKVKFDSNNDKSKSETYEIAQMMAEFKPTIICVEVLPSKNEELNNDYTNFLKNKDYKTQFDGEVALIAYEVGKISGVKKIYGIDEKETAQYNYNIGNELKNQVDSLTSKNFYASISSDLAEIEKLSTLDKLKFINGKKNLEYFKTINADILTYSSTKGNFEGADEASKFYRRNLRIFSNLNQVPVTKDDRILIIMGATHTAFLNEFMQGSPKYELINVSQYLN